MIPMHGGGLRGDQSQARRDLHHVSPDARDFVEGLLRWSGRDRLTASQACARPFLRALPAVEEPAASDLASAIRAVWQEYMRVFLAAGASARGAATASVAMHDVAEAGGGAAAQETAAATAVGEAVVADGVATTDNPPDGAKAPKTCSCRGRCLRTRHKTHGCLSILPAGEGEMGDACCVDCRCKARGCVKPLSDHAFGCNRHKQLIDGSSESMQAL